jgi:hypothetical protein
MSRQAAIWFVFLCTSASVTAQEVITGLSANPLIRSAWENPARKKGMFAYDTLELPFFDDFSSQNVFPDPEKWSDKHAYINNTYSKKQRSEGVATMDALDNTGRLYETASSLVFEADHLTSLPVNLQYPAGSDIYISFLYEPGGISDPPEPSDSLTLQLYAPQENKWYSVWRAPSAPKDTFNTAIILIDNPRFLKKGFRFRFINYASLGGTVSDPAMAGNCDIWNIDYVVLGKDRNSSDTLAPDVAFTKPVRSVLKTYESMPWNQFRQVFLSEMGPWITIHYMNNDKITRNVTRNFVISDVYKNINVYSFTAGATNIPASTPIDYNANLLYTFNTTLTDSALFSIKSILVTDVFDPKVNDTIIYYQKFSNYFAFDDGTAESGYGVNGLGSKNAMVAYRFKTFTTDTLRAIQICFNDSYQNANQRDFDLMVWSNNSGVPGDVLLTQEEMTVKQGTGINGLYTYTLTDPMALSGEFFVGWKQRSETFLNVGLDLNTPHDGKQLYWLNGQWNESLAPGSLIIRPVVGPKPITTGIITSRERRNRLIVWPNPASEYINIRTAELPLYGKTVIRVNDLYGREVIRTEYSDRLDISGLSPGVYLLVVEADSKQAGFAKFIKSR